MQKKTENKKKPGSQFQKAVKLPGKKQVHPPGEIDSFNIPTKKLHSNAQEKAPYNSTFLPQVAKSQEPILGSMNVLYKNNPCNYYQNPMGSFNFNPHGSNANVFQGNPQHAQGLSLHFQAPSMQQQYQQPPQQVQSPFVFDSMYQKGYHVANGGYFSNNIGNAPNFTKTDVLQKKPITLGQPDLSLNQQAFQSQDRPPIEQSERDRVNTVLKVLQGQLSCKDAGIDENNLPKCNSNLFSKRMKELEEKGINLGKVFGQEGSLFDFSYQSSRWVTDKVVLIEPNQINSGQSQQSYSLSNTNQLTQQNKEEHSLGNPSKLGLFSKKIAEIAKKVNQKNLFNLGGVNIQYPEVNNHQPNPK